MCVGGGGGGGGEVHKEKGELNLVGVVLSFCGFLWRRYVFFCSCFYDRWREERKG